MKKLSICLALFFSACWSSPQEERSFDWAVGIVRSVGDTFLRVDGLTTLRKYAPEAVPIFDVNNDSMITLEEVESVVRLVATNPEYATFIGVLAYEAYKNRKHTNDA